MQSTQNIIGNIYVIDNDVWESLTQMFMNKKKHKEIINEFYKVSYKYNIELKNLIKDYINFIVRYKSLYLNSDFLNFVEFIMHINEPNINYLLNYTILKLNELIN
jgi:hypothetical protein